MDIIEILKERIMVLDGAMGTMIQKYSLSESDFRGRRFASHPYKIKGCNDILNLTQPSIISQIHAEYLSAGADIIETNTFNAQSVSLSDYGLETYAYEINHEAARLARAAADEYFERDPMWYRFVAGCIGPTNRSASVPQDVNNPNFRFISYDELVNKYAVQIEGLMDGRVDMLLVETVFDILNAMAALDAISQVFEKKKRHLPVMVSVTISNESGCLLSGQNIEKFLVSVSHFSPLSVGINCSPGALQMKPFVEMIAAKAPYFVSIYPGAGLPDQSGEHKETAEQMAAIVEKYMSEGLVNIAGGCCGTTPEYITLLAQKARKYKPRKF
ncbi:MAG: homocysteine S-methyltransferase family protein [Bacteroidales bacterium]|nr:homocysteine S-methyltransferase family protein [Bacteroidales bacterium]